MRIRNIGPKISGLPLPGEIGEVDDELARRLISKGYAEDVSKLSTRLSEPAWPLRDHPGTGVEMVGTEVPLGETGTLGTWPDDPETFTTD